MKGERRLLQFGLLTVMALGACGPVPAPTEPTQTPELPKPTLPAQPSSQDTFPATVEIDEQPISGNSVCETAIFTVTGDLANPIAEQLYLSITDNEGHGGPKKVDLDPYREQAPDKDTISTSGKITPTSPLTITIETYETDGNGNVIGSPDSESVNLDCASPQLTEDQA